MSSFDPDKVQDLHAHLHAHLPEEPELRVKALESLLVDKGLIAPETIDAWIEAFSEAIGPKRGATLVARAWTDTAFRERLLRDGSAVLREMGFEGVEAAHFRVVENTPAVHNVIVCTLCSCYPWSVLGIPPDWYKTAAYRARVVREPRRVLAEFGVTLPEEIEIRVWDSTAELRYLVLPERPKGTEGWSEEQLASLVTRNAMIGTDRDLAAPEPARKD